MAHTPVSNGRIAIVMLIASELMFFTGLIAAYLVLRGTAGPWPPPDQPRLPLTITWINTFVLMLSAVTMRRSVNGLGAGNEARFRSSLGATALLGTTFLVIQGSEWVRLIRHGLTVSTSMYGATFYALIGAHGTHVLAAVIWLLALFAGSRRRGVDLLALYWYFVCGLWAVLFPLVYLV